MLKILNAVCSRSDKKVLEVPLFNLGYSEIVILEGSNGSGKSTFMSSFFGVHETSLIGVVEYEDTDISKASTLEKTNMGLYYVPQSMPRIDGVSLIKVLYFGSQEKKNGQSIIDYKKTLEEKIVSYGLDIKLLTANIGSDISGGQKKQMEMIGVIAQDKKVFFLDEIDSGVDEETKKLFAKIINELKNTGKSFVVVTHSNGFKDKLKVDSTYECTNNTITRI